MKNNKLGIKKIPNGRKEAKKINFDCVVKLENIDCLLRKYGISNVSSSNSSDVAQQEIFDIAIGLKNNKLTICGQQLSKQNDKNQFHLNFQIKNDALTIDVIGERVNSRSVQTKHDDMQVKLRRLQRKPISMAQIEGEKQSMQPVGKLSRSKTIAELANDAWKLCKAQDKNRLMTFKEDQCVIAKMKSYAPWPSKILGFTKNRKKVHVYFYGTHNSGSVEINEITPFQYSDEVIRLLLLRNLEFFAKGIMEAEIQLGIPAELSITNRHVLN